MYQLSSIKYITCNNQSRRNHYPLHQGPFTKGLAGGDIIIIASHSYSSTKLYKPNSLLQTTIAIFREIQAAGQKASSINI